MTENTLGELNEILYFVTSVIKIKTAVLEKMLAQKQDTKLSKLVKCVEKGMTEKEAVKNIYGNTLHTGKYRVLKLRLKNKLLNMIFMSDNDLAFKNAYYKTVYRLKRNITLAEFLRLKDKRKTAMNLLRPAFETALHYGETQEAVRCGKLLCEDAAYRGNSKNLKYYQTETTEQEKLLVQECEMLTLYHTVLSYAAQFSAYSSRVLKLIKQHFEKARIIHNRQHSYYIMFYYSRIAVLYYQSCDDHKNVIMECRKFSAYLKKFPHLYQDALFGEFALYEMDSHVRMRQYANGWRCAQRCLEHFIPFTTTWMQFHEYYFLFAMRTGKVEEAERVHKMITSSARFRNLPALQKERWWLHQAFLHFALHDDSAKRKQFNLFRFLNQMHLTNRDKPGYNFTVWVAKIILLINIWDPLKLIDMADSFKIYHSRYIKKEQYPRHYYFGRVLRQLLKNDFNFEDEIIKINLLTMNEIRDDVQSIEETEIIPYDVLWKMLREKCNAFIKLKQVA